MSEEITPSKKELKAQRKEARRLEKEKRRFLTVTENCKGCGTHMALDQQFCSGCGAKRMYNRLNWRTLFQDFSDRFLNLEGHFPRTFMALIKKPEDVIVGYIDGVRKKYISAFGYFAIALTLAGFYTFVIRKWFLEQFSGMQAAGMQITGGEDIPDEIRQANMEMAQNFTETLLEYNSLNYFITIPVVIIISRTVFWNYKKYNFVEHAVIHLYSFSQFAIISMLLQLATLWNNTLYMIVNVMVMFGMFFYSGYVLKRVFKLSWSNFTLKIGLFGLILGVLTVLIFSVGILTVAYGMKTGAFDGIEFFEIIKQQGEMQKAMKEAALQAKDSLKMDTIRAVKQVVVDTLPQVFKDSTKLFIK